MFGFEKLEVWQKAIELSDSVYAFTRHFPSEERFGLTSQMRRSSVSIASNIAEGSGRGSNPDFARFVEIAYGSLMELVTQMKIANRQGFLAKDIYDDVYVKSETISPNAQRPPFFANNARKALKPSSPNSQPSIPSDTKH